VPVTNAGAAAGDEGRHAGLELHRAGAAVRPVRFWLVVAAEKKARKTRSGREGGTGKVLEYTTRPAGGADERGAGGGNKGRWQPGTRRRWRTRPLSLVNLAMPRSDFFPFGLYGETMRIGCAAPARGGN
jgi:hypothetical protein